MCSIESCNNKVIRDNLCCRHLKQTCMICMDNTPITSTNTIKSKRLTCGHSFHIECISEWFITSDDCPVCRKTQPEDDPVISFRNKVQDSMREKYKDAIKTLEDEIKNLTETLNMQTMFSLASMMGPQSSNTNMGTHTFRFRLDDLMSQDSDLDELINRIARGN